MWEKCPTQLPLTLNNNLYAALDTRVGKVSVVSDSTNHVIGTVSARVAGGARGVALGSNNDKVYVTAFNSNFLSVNSGSRNKVTRRLTLGTEPPGVASDSSTNEIYVANFGEHNIYH